MKSRTISRHQQQGATLIVVLILLLLITIIGIIAIRTAITSLNIATNSQIGQLLVQTGDTPTNQFLNVADYKMLNGVDIVIGAAVKEHQTAPGKEYIFCYKPTSNQQMAASMDATVLVPPDANAVWDTKATIDSTQTSRNGFCNLEQDFGSAREAVVTQVAVRIPTDADKSLEAGALLESGGDLSLNSVAQNSKTPVTRVRITTTSILPSYASADLATVQKDCIGGASSVGYINDALDEGVAGTTGKRTVADCLASYGIPVNVQVQEIILRELEPENTSPASAWSP
ncbi:MULTISPECIES: PilX N-terminal domain-containing pilus assembly protein [unclassified Acinetobacter]|uniref:PilX N-terminal domain-containing pilus assembly protein n=1 Tax=unclassified Acinetobacter TaxID=196816 RepID=UPI002446D9D0|nr:MULTISPECIES: PilX N-terminal domain-containing pilus assembly protein [unclassified Acinetobacter]MDH0029832.1 hypothetical protein [Acinetobacter sp. GD04021]MDH0885404.1 hypothetical protein [Acinetobacter sp. GD03873]MDH1081522.1 hypothetical protein [Acinetobacter sp. GD03983]MDH2188697.1 hypothetical protein [Acinetobacter sp. GD03645]MDH2203420.1 hypothetical protein [Acinetobacter sp. GD03647]